MKERCSEEVVKGVYNRHPQTQGQTPLWSQKQTWENLAEVVECYFLHRKDVVQTDCD